MNSANAEWARPDRRYEVSFTRCRRAGVGSPCIAASFRRPDAKLAAEQGNLAGMIAVMRCKLPKHGMHRRLARRLWRADVLNSSLQRPRIGFRERGRAGQQISKTASRGLPRLGGRTIFGGRIWVRRPAFDRFLWIRSVLARNLAEVVVHPIVHVLYDLPDGMRIVWYGPGCQLRRDIFDAGDRVHVG